MNAARLNGGFVCSSAIFKRVWFLDLGRPALASVDSSCSGYGPTRSS